MTTGGPIVSLADVAEFIDTPVKFYSSGMQARLGFSVAVASRPDVLLVDEILAVGDVSFQMRSFDRMIELQKNGATILVVSHNLDAIRRVCSRVLVLNQGTPYFEGDAGEAIGKFHDLLRVTWDQAAQGMEGGPTADADAPLEVLDIELLDEDGTPTASFETGARMSARVGVREAPIAFIGRTPLANHRESWIVGTRSEVVLSNGDAFVWVGPRVIVETHGPCNVGGKRREGRDALRRLGGARPGEDERDVQEAVVERHRVAEEVTLAEVLAVIGSHDEQRVVEQARSIQSFAQAGEPVVHHSDGPVIQTPHALE